MRYLHKKVIHIFCGFLLFHQKGWGILFPFYPVSFPQTVRSSSVLSPQKTHGFSTFSPLVTHIKTVVRSGEFHILIDFALTFHRIDNRLLPKNRAPDDDEEMIEKMV